VIARLLRTVHHVDDFRSPSLVACQERSIRDPDAVVCVSRAWFAPVRAQFGVSAGLVTNGVDAARFPPSADAAARGRDRAALDLGDRLSVLAIGGIEPRKGPLTLLEAFALLRRELPGRRPLLVIGGGATLFDYRDEIDRFWALAAELGVEGDVRALGPLADDEVARAYRAADVLAFPSTREGFGLVPLEARAAGLPVVASDIDVLREFLTDDGNALLVPVGDAAALAGALRRVACDPGLAARLVAAGARTVAAHTWDRSAEAHEAVYARLLEQAATIAVPA
jgi:glycosyltransferase-like protein